MHEILMGDQRSVDNLDVVVVQEQNCQIWTRQSGNLLQMIMRKVDMDEVLTNKTLYLTELSMCCQERCHPARYFWHLAHIVMTDIKFDCCVVVKGLHIDSMLQFLNCLLFADCYCFWSAPQQRDDLYLGFQMHYVL